MKWLMLIFIGGCTVNFQVETTLQHKVEMVNLRKSLKQKKQAKRMPKSFL